jgi:cell cycle sensor histidine kinase DivJ
VRWRAGLDFRSDEGFASLPTSVADLRRKDPLRRQADVLFAAMWHGAWALAVLLGGGVLMLKGMSRPGPVIAALAIMASVALAGVVFSRLGRPGRLLAILAWSLGAAAAVHLTGGLGGPLAAWCLAPLAAAAAFQNREALAAGAAGAIAATAVACLQGMLAPLPLPGPAVEAWLSTLAVATVTLGLAAGLMGGQAGPAPRRALAPDNDLDEVLAAQPQMILTVGPDGRIWGAWGAPIGVPIASDLNGRNIAELTPMEDQLALDEALQAALQHGGARMSFAPLHDPNGWLELVLRRLPSGRLAASIRDASDQRAREQDLEHARTAAEQQNAGKTRFLATMSHELRTPLNAIMGFSDIMRQRLFGPMSDRYSEYAELIHESGSHLLELINDVLDMSKIEAERFELSREIFDARDSVASVLRLMRGQAERADVQLKGLLPREPINVDADRRALKQIALNLVSNALKFTPKEGIVTVTAQVRGEALEIVVADTGVGISEDDLDRLGRPFQQAGDPQMRVGGSGLGLSLVRSFATLHGGDMHIDSALGQGTTVTVRLPVLTSEAAAPRLRRAAPG